MKKKLLISLLAIISVLCFSFAFTACGNTENESINDGNSGTESGGSNTGTENETDKLSVVGKTFYFSHTTVDMEDKEASLKWKQKIESDLRGTEITFFADGTVGQGASWTQDGETVTITAYDMPVQYIVTENTLFQKATSELGYFDIIYTTQKPLQYTVKVVSTVPDTCTVSGGGTFNSGESVTVYTNPEKEGYYCLGWYDENDNRVATVGDFKKGYTFEAERDVTYTAKWIYCEVTINGVPEDAGSVSFRYIFDKWNNSVTIALNSNINSEYALLGCYTSPQSFMESIGNGLNKHTISISGPVTLEVICLHKQYYLEIHGYKLSCSYQGISLCGFNENWDSIIDVPDYVRTLEEGAFEGTMRVETIKLNKNIKRIKEKAFKGCGQLKSIIFDGTMQEWDKVYKADNWYAEIPDCELSFTSTDSTTKPSETGLLFLPVYRGGEIVGYSVNGKTDDANKNLVIPSEYNGKPVTMIAKWAFSHSDIVSVTIPETITKMDFGPFYDCKSLETVYWNAIRCTEEKFHSASVFQSCNKIKKVIFGENVEIIRGSAFSGIKLDYVILPKSLKKVEKLAFSMTEVKYFFYTGSAADWKNVEWEDSSGWEATPKPDVYIYSPAQPVSAGKYWHYVDGEAVAWEQV